MYYSNLVYDKFLWKYILFVKVIIYWGLFVLYLEIVCEWGIFLKSWVEEIWVNGK